ncbi:hypothetical protein PVAP13_7KG365400 [Panicum virgatum]|uniref:BRX domain-containing protein n=1 Tax=Panicum virgatum TaxID=38727 RepID=A0A8T0QRY1_PANVG|nr:hypothetical protein PVAP13_7KG365400 [Panicum virgatum]
MADPVDIDKALIALKKGTQLLKYGRKGKPKFTPFRLSNDESTLIWVSSNKEKTLKLASVSRILSGQRTLVFQRFLLPEKDHLSFSLIYNDGKRSLDLICKDKVEAEAWFTGLNALISPGQHGSQAQHIDGIRNAGLSFDCARESSLSSSSTFTSDSFENKLSSANSTKDRSSGEYTYSERTDVSDMQVKSVTSSDIRISVSSALSTSSHGSGGEDSESFGDIYVWGEVICDNTSKSGLDRSPCSPGATTDVLVPKPLESNVMLDVSYIACGVKHAALVTRQAEVFTWGEECSGRLGHGVGTNVFQPRLVESLSICNIEQIACGEFHTCAVTATGDLYTWGDGTHNAGLLGHGSNVSHWIPKRVSGPLDGLQVSTVSCGTWHTALITSSGQLYTFGDGTFGVLGHGNRESCSYPKEVESLKGLRTISVSCGVWHTAAVVEVIISQSNASSGKLFTWGDGDKYRLGHGDRSSKLKPTCVPSLIDYNFHRAACGHTLTIGLTTSGHMFTVGSSVYGQLGNPNNDGRYPRLVEEKLGGGGVVEVACGSYHVAVLTNAGSILYPQTPNSVASTRFGGLPAQVLQANDYNEMVIVPQEAFGEHLNGFREVSSVQQRTNGGTIGYHHRPGDHDWKETDRFQINLNNFTMRSSGSPNNQVEAEWIEQYEPGVYLTLVSLRDGTKELKRVRFSRRRFGEHQAESWWNDNREKVYDKYNVCGADRLSSIMTT